MVLRWTSRVMEMSWVSGDKIISVCWFWWFWSGQFECMKRCSETALCHSVTVCVNSQFSVFFSLLLQTFFRVLPHSLQFGVISCFTLKPNWNWDQCGKCVISQFETSVPICLCLCVCPAGEAVRDGGIEAADGGGGETEGWTQQHHRKTPTGNSWNCFCFY